MTDRIWEHFRKLASELLGDEVLLAELQQVANSPNTAREDHSALCAHRYSQGWRYGEVEDEHAKTSPLLRPWLELAEEQKENIRRLRAVGRCAAAVLRSIEL
jgi:RyR domain